MKTNSNNFLSVDNKLIPYHLSESVRTPVQSVVENAVSLVSRLLSTLTDQPRFAVVHDNKVSLYLSDSSVKYVLANSSDGKVKVTIRVFNNIQNRFSVRDCFYL